MKIGLLAFKPLVAMLDMFAVFSCFFSEKSEIIWIITINKNFYCILVILVISGYLCARISHRIVWTIENMQPFTVSEFGAFSNWFGLIVRGSHRLIDLKRFEVFSKIYILNCQIQDQQVITKKSFLRWAKRVKSKLCCSRPAKRQI